jgi:hypothetical protein
MRVPLALALLGALCGRGGADIAPLTKLTDPGARCMDGTLGGFYHQRATNPAEAGKWVIHMQGGGECVNSLQCTRRFNSSLASSDYFPDYVNFTYDPASGGHRRVAADLPDTPDVNCKWDKFGWWLCDDNPATNPGLYGYPPRVAALLFRGPLVRPEADPHRAPAARRTSQQHERLLLGAHNPERCARGAGRPGAR